MNGRRRGNPGLAKNGARLDRGRVKFGHHQGHRAIRLGRDEHGASRRRGAGVARRNERRRRPRSLERVEISGIVEEGEIARARLIKSGHIPDYTVGVSIGAERRAAPARNFGQRRRRARGERSESWPIGSSVRSDRGRASPGAPASWERRLVDLRTTCRPRS